MAIRDSRIAPPLRSPRNGLLTVVSVKDDETGVRWGNGVTWVAEQPAIDVTKFDEPANGESWLAARELGCAMTTLTVDARPVGETADPFNISAYSWCSMMQTDQRDRQARARRLLEATQSMLIAYELWTGEIASGQTGNDNSWLGNMVGLGSTGTIWPDNPYQTQSWAGGGNTAEPPTEQAIGRMDAYLTRALANGTGLLHMAPEFFSYLVAKFPGWLRLDGNVWKSPNGHSVVADAGYRGSAWMNEGDPNPKSEWVIATGPMEIVLGPIDATPENAPEAFSFATNDYVLYAQREVLVMWEPHVAHAGFWFTPVFDVFA